MEIASISTVDFTDYRIKCPKVFKNPKPNPNSTEPIQQFKMNLMKSKSRAVEMGNYLRHCPNLVSTGNKTKYQ